MLQANNFIDFTNSYCRFSTYHFQVEYYCLYLTNIKLIFEIYKCLFQNLKPTCSKIVINDKFIFQDSKLICMNTLQYLNYFVLLVEAKQNLDIEFVSVSWAHIGVEPISNARIFVNTDAIRV